MTASLNQMSVVIGTHLGSRGHQCVFCGVSLQHSCSAELQASRLVPKKSATSLCATLPSVYTVRR